jgi:hypothetical protein
LAVFLVELHSLIALSNVPRSMSQWLLRRPVTGGFFRRRLDYDHLGAPTYAREWDEVQ